MRPDGPARPGRAGPWSGFAAGKSGSCHPPPRTHGRSGRARAQERIESRTAATLVSLVMWHSPSSAPPIDRMHVRILEAGEHHRSLPARPPRCLDRRSPPERCRRRRRRSGRRARRPPRPSFGPRPPCTRRRRGARGRPVGGIRRCRREGSSRSARAVVSEPDAPLDCLSP